MKSSYVPSSVLGTTIEPSEMTLGTGVGAGILSRPVFATTATAAGTTVLTVTSASTQEATGVTTQTYTLPVVTTLVAGWPTVFINKSTGNVTLNSSGGNAIVVLAGGQSVTLVCKSISADTTAAAWDAVGKSPQVLTGTKDMSTYGQLTEGNVDFTTITVTGAVAGEMVEVMLPQPYSYGTIALLTAEVTAANTVTIFMFAEITGTDAEWDSGQMALARIVRY